MGLKEQTLGIENSNQKEWKLLNVLLWVPSSLRSSPHLFSIILVNNMLCWSSLNGITSKAFHWLDVYKYTSALSSSVQHSHPFRQEILIFIPLFLAHCQLLVAYVFCFRYLFASQPHRCGMWIYYSLILSTDFNISTGSTSISLAHSLRDSWQWLGNLDKEMDWDFYFFVLVSTKNNAHAVPSDYLVLRREFSFVFG